MIDTMRTKQNKRINVWKHRRCKNCHKDSAGANRECIDNSCGSSRLNMWVRYTQGFEHTHDDLTYPGKNAKLHARASCCIEI